VTLVTGAPHGFSVGDSITVALPTTAFLTKKKVDDGFVTLTTSVQHGFSSGDSMTIAMPENASIASKTIEASNITLGTSTEHGFSVGDAITVDLPETATISNYAFGGAAGGYLVTVQTAADHGFSVGDSITVAVSGSGGNTVSNGSRFIEAVTGVREFKFLYYGSNTAVNSASASGSVTNNTNTTINGEHVITQVPTDTTIVYER
jgi:hypothetical protein